jgi:hypothetical protein
MKTDKPSLLENGPSPGLCDTHVSSFLTHLRSEGYAERTLRRKRSVAASFVRWTAAKHLGVDDLNDSHLAAFVERSPRMRKPRVNFELAALRPFLDYLRPDGWALPGRPEEFHHQPPTEPCVNLSIYTARLSHAFAISQ